MQNKASIEGFQLHRGAKQAAFSRSARGPGDGSAFYIKWYMSARE